MVVTCIICCYFLIVIALSFHYNIHIILIYDYNIIYSYNIRFLIVEFIGLSDQLLILISVSVYETDYIE